MIRLHALAYKWLRLPVLPSTSLTKKPQLTRRAAFHRKALKVTPVQMASPPGITFPLPSPSFRHTSLASSAPQSIYNNRQIALLTPNPTQTMILVCCLETRWEPSTNVAVGGTLNPTSRFRRRNACPSIGSRFFYNFADEYPRDDGRRRKLLYGVSEEPTQAEGRVSSANEGSKDCPDLETRPHGVCSGSFIDSRGLGF